MRDRICAICSSRTHGFKCNCGYDETKNYDYYRTLLKIDTNIVSIYKKAREYKEKELDEKIDAKMEKNFADKLKMRNFAPKSNNKKQL